MKKLIIPVIIAMLSLNFFAFKASANTVNLLDGLIGYYLQEGITYETTAANDNNEETELGLRWGGSSLTYYLSEVSDITNYSLSLRGASKLDLYFYDSNDSLILQMNGIYAVANVDVKNVSSIKLVNSGGNWLYLKEFVLSGMSSSTPTPEPTPNPTPNPSPEPTPNPTPQPTAEPTPKPTPKPTVKPEAGNGSITLTWSAVEGATGYKIYRDGSLIANVDANTLSYRDTDVVNGTKYNYKIIAVTAESELIIGDTNLRPSDGLTFGDAKLGINVVDAVKTGVNWIKSTGKWSLLVLGAILAGAIMSIILWLNSINSKIEKNRKKNKSAAKQSAGNNKRKLTDADKERNRELAKRRRLEKKRDEKYEEYTRMGRIKERDAWVRQVKYLNPEQRAERTKKERLENLAKARAVRSERKGSNRSSSRSSRSRSRSGRTSTRNPRTR